MGGWLYDWTGSYDIAWGIAIGLSIVGGCLELANHGANTSGAESCDMSSNSILQVVATASLAMLITTLFLLYQNPLFEIYLTNWGIC